MPTLQTCGTVAAVCCNPQPGLPKPVVEAVHLIEDWGVEGDYHAGSSVRHRYLARKDPTRPNRRQVLLLDTSIYADMARQGISIGPGMMGENITVDQIAVMELVVGTRLRIGQALIEVTEIRNPCYQLNGIDPRLLKAAVTKEQGRVRFKAGVMACILEGGWVHPGDSVRVLPADDSPETNDSM